MHNQKSDGPSVPGSQASNNCCSYCAYYYSYYSSTALNNVLSAVVVGIGNIVAGIFQYWFDLERWVSGRLGDYSLKHETGTLRFGCEPS